LHQLSEVFHHFLQGWQGWLAEMIGDSQGRKLVKSEQLLGSLPMALILFIACLGFVPRLGCGKFPIPVWLGAPGTRVQFASFLDRCATSRTRHG
jgi:hypothetical protein